MRKLLATMFAALVALSAMAPAAGAQTGDLARADMCICLPGPDVI
jgi:hypothetical protein